MIVDSVALIFFMVAVLLFSLQRPASALLLPLYFHPIFQIRTQIYGVPTTALELMLTAVLVGFWVRNFKLFRVYFSPVVLLVVLFLFSSTISALVSQHPNTAWGVWKAYIIEPIIYAVTLHFALKQKQLLKSQVLRAIVSGGLIAVTASLFVPMFGENFFRFRGIYDVPNSLALIVAPLFPICFAAGFVYHMGWKWKLASFVFGIVLLSTQSITGLAAAVLVTLGFLFKKRVDKKYFFRMALLAILGGIILVSSGRFAHLLNPNSSSLVARLQIWQVSVRLIADNPLMGTGLGTFEPAYQAKLRQILDNRDRVLSPKVGPSGNSLPLEWVVRDPHNIFFSFWLNAGFLGLLSIIGLLFFKFKKSSDVNSREDALLTLGLLSVLIFGLLDVPYWKNDLALLWWVYWL